MNFLKATIYKLLDLRKTFWANTFVITSLVTYTSLITYVYLRNFLDSSFTDFVGPKIVSFMYCALYGPTIIFSILITVIAFIKVKELIIHKKLAIENQYILNNKTYSIIFLTGFILTIPTIFFIVLYISIILENAF